MEAGALTNGHCPTQQPPHLDPSRGEAVSLGFLSLTVLLPIDDESDFCVSGMHLLLNLSDDSEICLSFYRKAPESRGQAFVILLPCIHDGKQSIVFMEGKALFRICFLSTPEPGNFSLALHRMQASSGQLSPENLQVPFWPCYPHMLPPLRDPTL